MAHRIAAFTERDGDGVPASLGKKMIKKEEGKDTTGTFRHSFLSFSFTQFGFATMSSLILQPISLLSFIGNDLY